MASDQLLSELQVMRLQLHPDDDDDDDDDDDLTSRGTFMAQEGSKIWIFGGKNLLFWQDGSRVGPAP